MKRFIVYALLLLVIGCSQKSGVVVKDTDYLKYGTRASVIEQAWRKPDETMAFQNYQAQSNYSFWSAGGSWNRYGGSASGGGFSGTYTPSTIVWIYREKGYALFFAQKGVFNEDPNPINIKIWKLVGWENIKYEKVSTDRDKSVLTKTPEPKTTMVKRNIGTGFAVSPNGLIVTAYHVAEGASHIKVHLPGRGVFEARIEKSSPSTDILLLQIDAQVSTYLNPISTLSLSVGERVFTIGYPAINILGEEPKFTEGSIASLSGPGGDATYMQISVPVQPGNSGGPLVTERGEFVGVVIGTADVIKFLTSAGSLPQNVSWAIKADYVRALLPQSGVSNILLSREEAIKQTKRSICLIEAIK